MRLVSGRISSQRSEYINNYYAMPAAAMRVVQRQNDAKIDRLDSADRVIVIQFTAPETTQAKYAKQRIFQNFQQGLAVRWIGIINSRANLTDWEGPPDRCSDVVERGSDGTSSSGFFDGDAQVLRGSNTPCMSCISL